MDVFRASSAHKHMNCHASANLAAAIPGWVPPAEDDSADTAANRGTRMHDLFAQVMHMGVRDQKKFSEAVDYVAGVRSRRRFKVLIEEPRQATWLVDDPWCTADLVLYTRDELHVLDLKTGSIHVDVVDNPQLLFYALTYADLAPNAKGVTVHIVQPWADNCAAWEVTTAELATFMHEAQEAQEAILAGDVGFSPGDHCTFCPANPRARTAKGSPLCPVLMDMYYPELMDESEILED